MWDIRWRDDFFAVDVDIFVPVCIFPPYPRSLSAEKSRKSKGAAGCQPTPRPTALAGTMRATLQPIAHAESFLAAFSAPSQLLARLPLMRRHYSTSRETCFFHDNYPSLCEGRSSNGVLLERGGGGFRNSLEKNLGSLIVVRNLIRYLDRCNFRGKGNFIFRRISTRLDVFITYNATLHLDTCNYFTVGMESNCILYVARNVVVRETYERNRGLFRRRGGLCRKILCNTNVYRVRVHAWINLPFPRVSRITNKYRKYGYFKSTSCKG